MDDSGITVAVDEAKARIALAALRYIYGDIAIEVWAEMLEHQFTPPLPLGKHLTQQGLKR